MIWSFTIRAEIILVDDFSNCSAQEVEKITRAGPDYGELASSEGNSSVEARGGGQSGLTDTTGTAGMDMCQQQPTEGAKLQ
jgi:hypothetical protein